MSKDRIMEKGKLKIFLGYAAGVGKTCAMLDEAGVRKREGVDVAAGYIEPHDRPYTMALGKELETIPPRESEYRGIRVREFDLDGALARKPALILVDELAHTNAMGSRHKKRWQDVQELLDAGIDVYTTVNVQHLESLQDIVSSITQIRVNERVPDWIFDSADNVKLVDTPPEELIIRMREGKIYRPEQAKRAMNHFFNMENLTALREIALRRTADQVNRAVVRERQARGRDYYTGEHVLVCISPAPSNEKVIRTAARMSRAFRARLTAVAVDGTNGGQEREKFLEQVEKNLSLAKQFGADAVTLCGEDIPARIAAYAKQNGISKIVIGRTVRPTGLKGLLHGKKNLIDRLIALAPNMDVYVIPDVRAQVQKRQSGLMAAIRKTGRMFSSRKLAALGLAVGAGVPAVLAGAGITGYRQAGSVTAFVLFTVIVLAVCTVLTGVCALRLKYQVKMAREESRRLRIMMEFERDLKLTVTREQAFALCAERIWLIFGRAVIIYGADAEKRNLQRIPLSVTMQEAERLDTEREYSVAVWVMKNGHKAGRTTDTLPESAGYYLPLKQDGWVYGVAGILPDAEKPFHAEDKSLLHYMLDETAKAAEAMQKSDL